MKTIHAKIANERKDWNHKTTTELVKQYDKIFVGNVNSSKLTKTRMPKSVYDAGWSQFKSMLEYKAIWLSVEVKEVNESFSTVICSICGERTGSGGLSRLRVRGYVRVAKHLTTEMLGNLPVFRREKMSKAFRFQNNSYYICSIALEKEPWVKH